MRRAKIVGNAAACQPTATPAKWQHFFFFSFFLVADQEDDPKSTDWAEMNANIANQPLNMSVNVLCFDSVDDRRWAPSAYLPLTPPILLTYFFSFTSLCVVFVVVHVTFYFAFLIVVFFICDRYVRKLL